MGEDAKKKILLVDDERDILDAMQANLEGLGQEILLAHDGNEAVEMALEQDPDIIVLTGGMIAAGDLLMKPLEKYAREMFFPRPKASTRLALTALGGDAGIIGAGFCAQDSFGTSAS